MDFYHRSALILDALDQKKGSVKGLCMTEAKKSRKQGEASRFLKVIVEVLKYRPHLLHLLTKTSLLEEEPKLFIAPVWSDPVPIKVGSAASVSKALKDQAKAPRKARPVPTPISLATVMVHDLVFAKRGLTLPKEHKVRKKLDKYKEAMDKETARQRKLKKVSSNEGLQIALPEPVATAIESIGKGKKRVNQEMTEEDGHTLVRWLRVNTITWSVEEAVEWFESERWELCEGGVEEMLSRNEAGKGEKKVFALDAHVEPLLALPVGVSLPSLIPYQDSRLIAQDKASCLPPWILLSQILAEEDEENEMLLQEKEEQTEEEKEKRRERRKRNGVKVMDCTASPGNKTTFASAMAGENGLVWAIERDLGRYKVLKEMCKKAECENVTTMNADFLAIDPQDNKFKNVTHFLVDPSCSGSGIPSRLDHLLPPTAPSEQQTRIRALSNFQLTILSHALRFRGARRVVYSTCSIWAEEDEGVVLRLLKKNEFRERGWRLAGREEVVPSWERRGRVEECDGDEAIADSLVRCLPEDGTNGFFVACFVRDVAEGEEDVDAEVEDATEDVVEKEDVMTHAERQALFRAKSKAKGGRGGPKGVAPSPEKKEKVAEKAVKVPREKQAVPGKKAAYLVEKALMKKRKMEGEMRKEMGKKSKQ